LYKTAMIFHLLWTYCKARWCT